MNGEITQRKGRFDSKPAPITKGIQFETKLKAENFGGTLKAKGDSISFNGVKELKLFMVSNSSYYYNSYQIQNIKQLKNLEDYSFNELEQRHVKDHQSFFNRVVFDITTDNSLQKLPTDKRLEAVKKGRLDLELQETLFHFGRYLLISSLEKVLCLQIFKVYGTSTLMHHGMQIII